VIAFTDFQVFVWFFVTSLIIWLFREKWQFRIITASAILFLALYNPLSLMILSIMTVVTYYSLNRLPRLSLIIFILIGFTTALLVFFKMGLHSDCTAGKMLPLGISYYSFRLIHYIFENYKQSLPRHDPESFVHYMFFLPTIIIGPINRFPDFLKEKHRRRWDITKLLAGFERILYGYVKVIFIGNFLVSDILLTFIRTTFLNQGLLKAYIQSIQLWLNLYFQFSGYSDIAIGFALIMGFKITENFNFPFLAKNINDFWKRWHISLSSWIRDYVFSPLASSSRKPIVALIAAMIIMGLWHEFSQKYIIWGLYHSIGIAIWHRFQTFKLRLPEIKSKYLKGFMLVVSVIFTQNFVIGSFLFTSLLPAFLGNK